MFKTIVLATDGSKEAEKAEQTAIELARENGASFLRTLSTSALRRRATCRP